MWLSEEEVHALGFAGLALEGDNFFVFEELSGHIKKLVLFDLPFDLTHKPAHGQQFT